MVFVKIRISYGASDNYLFARLQCPLHLCCHWPQRLLSHAYNAPALRFDFKVTYLLSQP